ncbi:EAL domain-containing protein [Arcobacter sp. YIC-464]|uniref:EAL domain-containing protein n=1 Tax=Arcobacter sp. YIC-464 TaxID=3376631 RepID=UPI003C1E3ACD
MLKNKLFILIISITSLSLILSGIVYYKNINSVFEEQAILNINHDKKIFNSFLQDKKNQIKKLSENIINNENTKLSLNLISNYQDKNNYSKEIFDYEKERLLELSSQWVSLEEGISISLFDKNKNLVLVNSKVENIRNFGYTSFKDKKEVFVNKIDKNNTQVPKIKNINEFKLESFNFIERQNIIVSIFLKEIYLGENLVGYIKVCFNIDQELLDSLKDTFMNKIVLQFDNQKYIFDRELDAQKFKIIEKSKNYLIKKSKIDETNDSIYLINILDKQIINNKIGKTFETIIIIWLVILSITIFLSFMFTNKYILRPIENLQDIIKDIKKKTNVTTSIQTNSSKDEIKVIRDDFRELAKALDKNIAFLNSYQAIMDEAAIVSKSDLTGKITYVNDNFVKISGYSRKEAIGSPHSIIRHPDTPKEVFEDLWNTIQNKGIWKGTLKNKRKDGTFYWVNLLIRPLLDENNNIAKYIAFRYDITELIEQRETIKKAANTDKLTGLCNRVKLIKDIKKLDSPALSFFNVDSFRQINDFYGHFFGDILIKELAEFLSNKFIHSKHIKVYRTQADEFALLANLSNEFEKEAFFGEIYRLNRKINNKQFKIENEDLNINITSSISYEDSEKILSTANMALKHAKKNSVDLLVYKDDYSLDKIYENNIKWAKNLKTAIRTDKIVPFFQPIINNKTGQIEKYESLVRLIDEDNKVVSPFFFLNIAKKTKHYETITKTVIKKSFEKFKNSTYEFSVNLTIEDILNANIQSYIFLMLDKYQIGSKVVFEIVESESIENFNEVSKFISEVKKYGVKIAIDDFGTGYSNFEYLLKLKADYIKIDGSMIKDIHKNEDSKTVVSVIVDFAKKMNMKTIAEFVENEEILYVIKELDIDYSQGYYFSAPKRDID